MHRPTTRPLQPLPCSVLLLGAALLLALRNPLLLLHGRVYAEEGTTYLRFAWNADWPHALLAAHQGYYFLVPNLATLFAARVLPLADAALLFPWCAFLFQLLAVWIAIRCDAFATTRSKVLAALVVVLAPPSGETWLNTINTQFYLAICTALIAISKPRRAYLCILLLSGLTGVVSCFLLPFFWLRAFADRTRAVITQAALLSACTALQIVVVARLGLRPIHHHLAYLVEACADKNVLFAFGTSFPATRFGNLALAHPSAALPLAILLLAGLAMLLFRVLPVGGRPAISLATMAVWGQVFTLFGGMDLGRLLVLPYANGRYFLFSNVCLGLALVSAWERSPIGSRTRMIAAGCIGAMLLSGLSDFRRARMQTTLGPDWRSQVQLWQSHPETPIRIFPGQWRPLHLSAHHPGLRLPDNAYDNTDAGPTPSP